MTVTKTDIKTWKQFSRKVRKQKKPMLKCLGNYPDSVLVTGCQRSGTTILSRIITQGDGMVNYWFGRDDELDAALILSGMVAYQKAGRFCFQTTYLNECYAEYFNHDGRFRMIWVVRNPFSVVYSLLYNWRRWTLNELFMGCGAELLEADQLSRFQRFGHLSVPRIVKACLSYNGKVSQLFKLIDHLKDRSVLAVNYDELVENPDHYLGEIFDFIDVKYKPSYGKMIHRNSVKKKDGLSKKEINMVKTLCGPDYQTALSICIK